MPYDRLGRTPEMAHRERLYDLLCIAALGLMIGCVTTIAMLVVMLLGG